MSRKGLKIFLDKRIADIKNYLERNNLKSFPLQIRYLEFNEREEDEDGFSPSEELKICNIAKNTLNLEEELGIDLITKDKIEQSNVCYWKDKSKKIHKLFINATERIGVDVENIDGQKWFLYYKDYGKTWALDKKELTMEELEQWKD